jgi:hypothetical protein
MRDEMIKSGILSETFDKFIDVYKISGLESGAPFSYEGIHYPNVMYRAELEVLLSNLMGKDRKIQPETKQDLEGKKKSEPIPKTNEKDLFGRKADENEEINQRQAVDGEEKDVDYKSLLKKSLEQLKQLEDKKKERDKMRTSTSSGIGNDNDMKSPSSSSSTTSSSTSPAQNNDVIFNSIIKSHSSSYPEFTEDGFHEHYSPEG